MKHWDYTGCCIRLRLQQVGHELNMVEDVRGILCGDVGMLLRCGVVVVLFAAFGIRHDMPMFVAFVAICGSVSPHQCLSTVQDLPQDIPINPDKFHRLSFPILKLLNLHGFYMSIHNLPLYLPQVFIIYSTSHIITSVSPEVSPDVSHQSPPCGDRVVALPPTLNFRQAQGVAPAEAAA